MSSDADTAGFPTMIPFARLVGVEVESAEPGEVRCRLPYAEERCTAAGTLHGGALMTLADTSGAICAFLNLPEGATTSTLESKTNFFRAARGDVVVTSRPLHVGRTTIVVQSSIVDGEARLVAQVTQTQMVLTA